MPDSLYPRNSSSQDQQMDHLPSREINDVSVIGLDLKFSLWWPIDRPLC
jgi:hypothetical protein